MKLLGAYRFYYNKAINFINTEIERRIEIEKIYKKIAIKYID